MIISANQPFFAPYPGFFEKALLSDVFVLLDTVQFPRGTTWTSRNRFKNDQGTLWLTVPVQRKGLGLQPMDRVRICRDVKWIRKHLSSLDAAYKKAPFFSDHFRFLESTYSRLPERLIDLNLLIITYLFRELGISTRIFHLSELGIRSRGTRLLVDICKSLGSRQFLAQRSAGKHLDEALFLENEIELQLFQVKKPVYPQLWGPFLNNLSAFDLLFTCGPRAGEYILDHSAIIQ